MNKLTKLFLGLVALGLPSLGQAAVGDSCTIANAASGATGSAKVNCILGVDSTAAGAFTAGPVYVPGGGVGASVVVIRPLNGNSGAGCGYDDVVVYETSNATATGNDEKASIGVLDDDGTSTPTGGVQQIKVFGPTGPYLYFSGTATAGTCSGTERLQIQIIVYPTAPNL